MAKKKAEQPVVLDEVSEITREQFDALSERAKGGLSMPTIQTEPRSIDERVAAVFNAPEPVGDSIILGDAEAVESFLREARECQAVFAAGNPVSPYELKSLVSRAIGLLGR